MIVLLAAFAVAEVARYGGFLLSWLVLGRAALHGTVGGGTVGWWAAALALSLASGAATVRLQATVAVRIGTGLRTRLLAGLLRIPDEHAGSALLLGRSLEVETVEDQLAGEAVRNLGAPVDLVLAAVLLAAALGPLSLLALGSWLAAAGWAAARYTYHRRMWTDRRLELAADATAKLAGHRTRAAQQPPGRRHEGEAAALAGYTAVARPMDRWRVALMAGVPRGWALTGVLLIAALARHADQATIAAAAAGVLFTTAALTRTGAGLTGLVEAHAAWRQLRTVLDTPPVPAESALPPAERNHLLLAPLAMNLLLGRSWPAAEQDLAEAEQLCRRLGLGDLIDRMPGGLGQLVGETGWQLSAGERSLVFLARALLADPDVPVPEHALDALDPATRARALARP